MLYTIVTMLNVTARMLQRNSISGQSDKNNLILYLQIFRSGCPQEREIGKFRHRSRSPIPSYLQPAQELQYNSNHTRVSAIICESTLYSTRSTDLIKRLPFSMMHKVARRVMAKSVNATAARTITVAAKSNIFSRAYDRISGKSALQSEKTDIEMLENFTKLTMSLSQIIIPQSHPLNDLAEKIKALHSINESNTAVKDILMV